MMTNQLPDESYVNTLAYDPTEHTTNDQASDDYYTMEFAGMRRDDDDMPESTSFDEPNDTDEDWLPGGRMYEWFEHCRREREAGRDPYGFTTRLSSVDDETAF